MNRKGITCDLKTINFVLEGNENIKPFDIIDLRNVNIHIQWLYNNPNTPYEISNKLTYDLLRGRLQMEHSENKFDFWQKRIATGIGLFVCYCKDNELQQMAALIDSYIDELLTEPKRWIVIDCFDSEEDNLIFFARIFQRLRNEHSNIVEKFLPRFIESNIPNEGKYYICNDN